MMRRTQNGPRECANTQRGPESTNGIEVRCELFPYFISDLSAVRQRFAAVGQVPRGFIRRLECAPAVAQVGASSPAMNREAFIRHRGRAADYYIVFVGVGDTKTSLGATDSYELAINWIQNASDRVAVHHGNATLIRYDSGFHAVYADGHHALYEVEHHYFSE